MATGCEHCSWPGIEQDLATCSLACARRGDGSCESHSSAARGEVSADVGAPARGRADRRACMVVVGQSQICLLCLLGSAGRVPRSLMWNSSCFDLFEQLDASSSRICLAAAELLLLSALFLLLFDCFFFSGSPGLRAAGPFRRAEDRPIPGPPLSSRSDGREGPRW